MRQCFETSFCPRREYLPGRTVCELRAFGGSGVRQCFETPFYRLLGVPEKSSVSKRFSARDRSIFLVARFASCGLMGVPWGSGLRQCFETPFYGLLGVPEKSSVSKRHSARDRSIFRVARFASYGLLGVPCEMRQCFETPFTGFWGFRRKAVFRNAFPPATGWSHGLRVTGFWGFRGEAVFRNAIYVLLGVPEKSSVSKRLPPTTGVSSWSHGLRVAGFWGFRGEAVFRNAIYVLLEVPEKSSVSKRFSARDRSIFLVARFASYGLLGVVSKRLCTGFWGFRRKAVFRNAFPPATGWSHGLRVTGFWGFRVR